MKFFVVRNIILSIVLNNLLIFGSQKCCVCCCKNKSTLHDNSTTNEINNKKKPIINKKTKISKKYQIYDKHKSKQKKDNLKKSYKYNLVDDKKNIINKGVDRKSLSSNSKKQNTKNINTNEYSVEGNSREYNNLYNSSQQKNNLDKYLGTIEYEGSEDSEDSEDYIINNGTDLNSLLKNSTEDELDKIINIFAKKCKIEDKYKIIGGLPKGGCAEVFLATNVETNEKVAIKKIDKSSLDEKSKKQRLFREFYIFDKITKSYSSDNVQDLDRNIVLLKKICQDKENYYIIQEYCENGDLFEYIDNKGKPKNLKYDDIKCYFYQLINGVSYLHSLGFVHRDLKLENLLLNDKFILKICDFGLSTFFEKESNLLNSFCGTPICVAPELLESTSYDGGKADIFSCGVILYFLKYLDYPFQAQRDFNEDHELDITEALAEQSKNKRIENYSDFDEEFKLLIEGMLEYDPKKRISIDKIKNSDFYLTGKKIFNEKYKGLKT